MSAAPECWCPWALQVTMPGQHFSDCPSFVWEPGAWGHPETVRAAAERLASLVGPDQ